MAVDLGLFSPFTGIHIAATGNSIIARISSVVSIPRLLYFYMGREIAEKSNGVSISPLSIDHVMGR